MNLTTFGRFLAILGGGIILLHHLKIKLYNVELGSRE